MAGKQVVTRKIYPFGSGTGKSAVLSISKRWCCKIKGHLWYFTCFSLWIRVFLQVQKTWFRVKLTMQKAWFRAILCDKNTCLLGKYRLTYPQLYVNYPKERHEIFVLKPIKNIMYLRCFSIILAFLTKADECFCKRKVLKIELQPIDFPKNVVFKCNDAA